MRSSPSGPIARLKLILSGNAPALAGAGSADTMSIANANIVAGDTAYCFSTTLNAAGVVITGAASLADGTLILNLLATKAYAGGAIADIAATVFRG